MVLPITPAALTPTEIFFYEHAGYSWHVGSETPEHGHVRTARELAAAERRIHRGPFYVTATDDPAGELSAGESDPGPWFTVTLWRIGDQGAPDEWIDAVGGIDSDSEPTVRVVAAQLALESIPVDADDRRHAPR
jgi:hypothetical protein